MADVAGAHAMGTFVNSRKPTLDQTRDTKEKIPYAIGTDPEATSTEDKSEASILENERELVSRVISVDDDPSLNPWTLRSFVIGLGLSAFGGSLAQIYYFKPMTIYVSIMFLSIVSYVVGIMMEAFIPRWGLLRYLNPHPFNKKENAFIIIMASAASTAALATEVLAVQQLYYNISPRPAIALFLILSSQLLGYGIGGMMRSILVHPSKMLYPTTIPMISMLDAFFQDGKAAQRRLRIFYMTFIGIFIWELFPQWIFPMLTGFSIFCLVAPRTDTVSRLFGGSNANEGLGILSLCLDWQYIGSINPMAIPLKVMFSAMIGYLISLIVMSSVYFGNVWKAKNFPMLSQLLFYENGTVYDQTLIIDGNYEVDPALVAEQGLPYFASSWVAYNIAATLSLGAIITHFLLWNRDDLRGAWGWMNLNAIREMWQNFEWKFWKDDGTHPQPDPLENLDPHYAQMLKVPSLSCMHPQSLTDSKYPDTPNSWFFVITMLSIAIGLLVNYESDSTLPWWSLVLAMLLANIFILFIVALYAMTGFAFSIQSFVQMIAGYLHPRKPMANMYFVLFSYNSTNQAELLLRDLKIAQYTKLPPRAAFTAQMVGTIFGACLNYVLMNSIVTNQKEILLSVQGTNVWSGWQVQMYNSQAIAWGGFSQELFSAGKRYQWVPYAYVIGLIAPVPFWLIHRYWPNLHADYLSIPLICGFIATIHGGISSVPLSYFSIGFFSQWYLRTRHPRWFQKYNYIVGAALDGGAQVMVFILSFAVFGASGHTHLFPECEWHDAHSAVKYTDVDYRVFSDAARFLLKPNATQGNVGKGPLMAWLGLQIGSPYTRETYRYTPLLAVLLLPNGFLLSFGKYLFAACDLVNGILIYRTLKTFILPSPDSAPASRQEKPMEESNCGVNNLQNGVISQHDAVATFLAGTHLLNPLVFSISTRGSSESILCTFVLLTLHLALKRRWNMAAILLGVSTHWKIYPFIYGASCVAVVSSETRRVGRDTSPLQALISKSTIRFAIVSASTFFALGGLCYAVYVPIDGAFSQSP
ncbi:hypothetical protein ID866_7144 [Astraeus odoratus]|nr:hypothetical protein ID866_7144 [Astraeus odoratus]